ncbi:hypothetical protein PLESTF_001580900 [Pleodorina starrii]|nr:hypothetical protein PLESTF_001580900 [Pleodorina starrii]
MQELRRLGGNASEIAQPPPPLEEPLYRQPAQRRAPTAVVPAEAGGIPAQRVLSAPTVAAPPPRRPTMNMSDFTVARVIGMGAFGRVSLARHNGTGRIVAIKAVSKAFIVKNDQISHILDERFLMKRVAGYPFIVTLLGTFQDRDCLYFVMEYMAGGELFTHVRDNGVLNPQATRFYVAQMVLALEHLHGKGIVHRDIKLENVLMSAEGYIKVSDLGFSKVLHDNQRTHTMCGTPDYMAPEIIKGKGHNLAVDWWAVGCVTFELLDGYPPFYAAEIPDIYRRILAHKSGSLKFKPYVEQVSKDFVNQLLHAVKAHPWFQGYDWEALAERCYMPPYKPKLTSPEDTSRFDRFDRLPPVESAQNLRPQQQAMFNPFTEYY